MSVLVAVTLLNTIKLQTFGASTSTLPVEGLMYLAAIISSFFLLKGARLGSLMAGVLLWLTAATVLENYLASGSFFQPNAFLIAELILLPIGIISAHVRFHETAP
jgi:hypothetical protein